MSNRPVDKTIAFDHIIYIITKLELGGAQKVCLSLACGLDSKNENSCTLISGETGTLVTATQKLKSVYLLKTMQREIGFGMIWKECKNFFTLVSLLRKIKHEHKNIIVHTHSTKAGIIGRWAAYVAGLPYRIHTVHGYGFNDYQSWPKWILIYLAELFTSFITTHFIYVSKIDQKNGERLFPNIKSKGSIIRAAVEDNKFYPIKTTANIEKNKKFIIGTLSCFKEQKNLIDLLKAFNLVIEMISIDKKNDVLLNIVGDGHQRPILEKFIADHNLQNNVALLGWRHDVPELLRTWDIFALSSLWEGLPCAIIEARLTKLPIIAYNVGGISEVIENNLNGHLINPGDWKQMAKKMVQLITNFDHYQKLSQYSDNLQDFTNKSMIESHVNLYSEVIRKKKKLLHSGKQAYGTSPSAS